MDCPWLYETSKCAPQEALRDLDVAFANFFRRVALKKAGQLTGKVGYPRFKSRKRGIGSFRLTGAIKVFPRHIQLPRLGKLRLKERDYLPVGAHILSATVSERAGRWFVSVQVVMELPDPTPATGPALGVDLGIKPPRTGAGNVFGWPNLRQSQSAVRRAAISKKRCSYLNGRTSAKRAAQSRIAISTPPAILHSWLPRVPREGTPVERV